MDYLNPKKRKSHLIRLFVGYGLIGIAVALAVVVLFFLVLGFSYNDGKVVRNGMLYINSTPEGARITANGIPSGKTNRRLITPAGKYQISLDKDGYRPWKRTIHLTGGNVQRYPYPLLVPNKLISSSVLSIDVTPRLVAQSMDSRWLLFSNPIDSRMFRLVDLSNPTKPAITNYALSANLLSKAPASASDDWQFVEWSNDNSHLLLKHNYGSKHEYVVLDRSDPAKTVNLNTVFKKELPEVKLFNGEYDKYWVFNSSSGVLSRANLKNKVLRPYLRGVLAYKAYQDDRVLYVSSDGAALGRAHILLYQNGRSYPIELDAKIGRDPSDYLLDLAKYRGNIYLAVGVSSGDSISVYKNPIERLASHPNQLEPINKLPIVSPKYVKFSPNSRFILAESGRQVSVYNTEYDKGYSYAPEHLDKPQTHLEWIDGYHLSYVGSDQLIVIDFNNLNQQTLVVASSRYGAYLSPDRKYLFTLVNVHGKDGKDVTRLNRTALRVAEDL